MSFVLLTCFLGPNVFEGVKKIRCLFQMKRARPQKYVILKHSFVQLNSFRNERHRKTSVRFDAASENPRFTPTADVI